MGDWQGGGQEWSSYNQDTDWGSAGHGQVGVENIKYENHDLAIARSSSSRADPGLRVAFKCLNVILVSLPWLPGWRLLNV